jgi:hypothetical protein
MRLAFVGWLANTDVPPLCSFSIGEIIASGRKPACAPAKYEADIIRIELLPRRRRARAQQLRRREAEIVPEFERTRDGATHKKPRGPEGGRKDRGAERDAMMRPLAGLYRVPGRITPSPLLPLMPVPAPLGAENAPAPPLKPALGALLDDPGCVTIAPLAELLAPAPGMEGAPDGGVGVPAPVTPRPPPRLDPLLDVEPPALRPPPPRCDDPRAFRPAPGAVPVALAAVPAAAPEEKPVCAAAVRLNAAAPRPRSTSVERIPCIIDASCRIEGGDAPP